MMFALGVVAFAVCILLSVALHECGHMWVARGTGMKVRRYFVGFGPTVFSFRRGETEYGLKWLPLGGFCDIAGMTALDEVTPDEASRAMWRFKTWKRTVVLAAGSFTHFVFGFIVLYLMAVTMGLPNLAAKPVINTVSDCVRSATTAEEWNDPTCRPGDPAPAKSAGLRPGDRILAIDSIAIGFWNELVEVVQQRGDRPMRVRWLRPDTSAAVPEGAVLVARRPDGVVYEATIRPYYDPEANRYFLGIAAPTPQLLMAYFGVQRVRYGIGAALLAGVEETWTHTRVILTSLRRMVTGQESFRENVGGPIMIAKVT